MGCCGRRRRRRQGRGRGLRQGEEQREFSRSFPPLLPPLPMVFLPFSPPRKPSPRRPGRPPRSSLRGRLPRSRRAGALARKYGTNRRPMKSQFRWAESRPDQEKYAPARCSRRHFFFSRHSSERGREKKNLNSMRALSRLSSSSSASPRFGALAAAAATGLSGAPPQQRRVPSGAVASSSAKKEKAVVVRSLSPSVFSPPRCLSSSLSRRRAPSLVVARAFSDDEDEDYDDVELDGEGFFGVSF